VGLSLLFGGSAIILATIGALAGALDDRTGAYFVATTVTVAAAGIVFWSFLHRSRRPSPPRRRAQPVPVPLAARGVPDLDDAAVADSLARLDAAAEALDSGLAGDESGAQDTRGEPTRVAILENDAEDAIAAQPTPFLDEADVAEDRADGDGAHESAQLPEEDEAEPIAASAQGATGSRPPPAGGDRGA
jgi:hypothetical protein